MDAIVVTGNNIVEAERLNKHLGAIFEIKDLGE